MRVLFISIVMTLAGLLGAQHHPSGIIAKPGNVIEIFQPNKPLIRSGFTNRIEAAIVLVGALSQSSGLKTFGTGFIVEHSKIAYVVTCKHVVLEASSPHLFAIPKPQKTKTPPGGYVPMRLGNPIYHPNDGIAGTYDIAVLEIVGLGKKTLSSHGISPLSISMKFAEYAEGERLEAAGYPVEYADRELALGKLEPLLPLRIKGIVSKVPLETFAQTGFVGSLLEGHFAQTVERPFGKGASGGPVYLNDGKDSVVGVLLGSADVKVDIDGRSTSLMGFVFASSLRIMETIKSRLPTKAGTLRRRVEVPPMNKPDDAWKRLLSIHQVGKFSGMKATTKVEVLREGQARWVSETECQTPEVVLADPTGIFDFSKLRTQPANECIYCGSHSNLSREHVLPYALGGTVTIPRGCCERCRKITHAFETAVLRGPMQMVRYIQNAPSRSKHQDVPLTIPVKLTLNGREELIETPRDEAPILLPFPVFARPKTNGSDVKLISVVTGSFGADLETFAKRRGTKEIEIRILQRDAIAFGQMVAKIAYATAYVEGLLPRLEDKEALVHSFLKAPNTLGQFVGTLSPPFKKYPGVQHRIAFHETAAEVMFAEVQLFASAGAPTYEVILGNRISAFD